MTYDELIKSDKEMLTVGDIVPILGLAHRTITMQAREAPWMLGFPVIVAGNSIRIPRKGFLSYITGNINNQRENE